MNEEERRGGLTLLLCDGEGEEGDEGGHGQDGEEHADHDKELQPLEPGAPVVLQVHDVCDQSPDGQNSCQDTNTHSNDINHWGNCWVWLGCGSFNWTKQIIFYKNQILMLPWTFVWITL